MNVQQVAKINPSVLMPLFTAPVVPQNTRQARRLYVGNIPTNIPEQDLVDFFNKAMSAAGLSDEETCVAGVQMNYEKNFAFIEFRTIDEASKGMGLDGITLQGNSLKIRRPKDYQAPAAPSSYIPGIISTNVPDSPNKIFVGGLPANLNEEQVKDLLSAFGPLKSFNLVKDTVTGNSKGYAFFEYLDADVTDKACAGLNGMKLQDKTLLVQRATEGAKPGSAPLTSMQLQSALGSNPTAAAFLNLQLPVATLLAQMPGMTGPMSQQSTSVLMLFNMISPDDISSEAEVEEIKKDIYDECSTFGFVKSIEIPRPEADNAGIVKVYVEFDRPESAKSAQIGLSGRKFNHRLVISSFYSEERYHNHELI